MDKARLREIASKGGKAAHAQGTAHEWDSAEAAEAGRLGGQRAYLNRVGAHAAAPPAPPAPHRGVSR